MYSLCLNYIPHSLLVSLEPCNKWSLHPSPSVIYPQGKVQKPKNASPITLNHDSSIPVQVKMFLVFLLYFIYFVFAPIFYCFSQKTTLIFFPISCISLSRLRPWFAVSVIITKWIPKLGLQSSSLTLCYRGHYACYPRQKSFYEAIKSWELLLNFHPSLSLGAAELFCLSGLFIGSSLQTSWAPSCP